MRELRYRTQHRLVAPGSTARRRRASATRSVPHVPHRETATARAGARAWPIETTAATAARAAVGARPTLAQKLSRRAGKLKGCLSHVNPGFTTGQLLVALAGGSAQNHRAQPAAGPGSEQDGRDTTGSAQNQRVPLVRDRSSDRTPHHAAGSADAGFLMPAPAPSAAGPSAALACGSAQNRRTQPVAAPSSEQDRRSTTGSAPNQQPPRAGIVGARTKTEPHRAVRARLPAEGTAAPPTAPESARARRTRRHIPAAVRRAVWRKYGGACCYQDPLTGVTCGSTHPATDRPHRAGGAGRQ